MASMVERELGKHMQEFTDFLSAGVTLDDGEDGYFIVYAASVDHQPRVAERLVFGRSDKAGLNAYGIADLLQQHERNAMRDGVWVTVHQYHTSGLVTVQPHSREILFEVRRGKGTTQAQWLEALGHCVEFYRHLTFSAQLNTGAGVFPCCCCTVRKTASGDFIKSAEWIRTEVDAAVAALKSGGGGDDGADSGVEAPAKAPTKAPVQAKTKKKKKGTKGKSKKGAPNTGAVTPKKPRSKKEATGEAHALSRV